MKINSVEELDEVMNQDFRTDTQRWARVIGFYKRVRWDSSQSFGDFLDTTNSLKKSLEKQGHELTPECVIELLKLYIGEDEP